MYIQYLGFDVASSSRTYTFHVIDAPYEARDFTVKVESEAFRPDCLRFQDGPDICYTRLAQELRGQTPESRCEAHLSIGEQEIRDYVEQHHPKKPPAKRKEEHVISPANKPADWWRPR
jgi:hypothetical protein